MRGATGITLQPHQILRLPCKRSVMIDPSLVWNVIYNARSDRNHPATSPNTAPAMQKECHDWSFSRMKRHLQCAERQESPCNLTKYCACHAKLQSHIEAKFTENGWSGISNARPIRPWSENDPRMIRPWKRKPQPAAPPRLLFALAKSRFYWKLQRFPVRLSFHISQNAAPATKSDTWTSPNAAPATKSDTWTSPNAAPATKSDTWTSPNAAPATKSDTWTSPNAAPATKSENYYYYYYYYYYYDYYDYYDDDDYYYYYYDYYYYYYDYNYYDDYYYDYCDYYDYYEYDYDYYDDYYYYYDYNYYDDYYYDYDYDYDYYYYYNDYYYYYNYDYNYYYYYYDDYYC